MSQQSRHTVAQRQRWLAVLARAGLAELEAALRTETPGSYTVLKPAEVGTIMVEGRAGGSGRRFNAGEATLTRCVLRLADGTLGVSYALGRDRARAEVAALVDGLLQQQPAQSPLHRAIAALEEAQAAARTLASRKAAATRVEFFTMVRGD
jgi:alpha-D-ribose 1-methylphosphonate 5-triphosphate synthase subunit PhnG